VYSLIGLTPYCYGAISAHHIVAGFFGIAVGFWHLTTRPSATFYKLLLMGNIEEALSSSLSLVFFTAFISSALSKHGNKFQISWCFMII
jgi:hypothetical protein